MSIVPSATNENLNKNTVSSVMNKLTDNSQFARKDYTDYIIKNGLISKEIIFLKYINFSLSDCCQNTYNSKIICNNVLQIAESTKYCKSEWQKERKFRVTGSRYKIMIIC